MFRVGQKVVCIKRGSWGGAEAFGDETFPSFEEVYTVRQVEKHFVRLLEIVNPVHAYHGYGCALTEASFRPDRFRPIVESKTDISIFTEILRRESAPSPLAEA